MEIDYKKDYEDFWKDIVENEDGTLNKDQIMRELSDFGRMIGSVSKVYDHITGGHVSKPTTDASIVISIADEHYLEIENKNRRYG